MKLTGANIVEEDATMLGRWAGGRQERGASVALNNQAWRERDEDGLIYTRGEETMGELGLNNSLK